MKTESNEWPSQDVLRKLIEAAEILLHRMDYDGDEYEDISHCVERAKQHLQPQPAEDPDEWVIQNRVPRRVKVDQFVYLSPREMSLAIPEESWQFFRWSSGCPAGEMASDGRKHGFVTVNGNTLHVRCRRRDLPKVEQAEPEPEPEPRVFRVTDGERYLTCQSFRDRFVLIPEDGGVPFTTIELSWHNLRKCPAVDVPSEKTEPQSQNTDDGIKWSYHEKQKPQPKKKMLRLWVDSDGNIHAGLKGDRDLELLYDHETRQFYTEETR